MDYETNEMAAQIEAELNPDQMDDDELQGIAASELDDARDWIDNTVSPIEQTRQNTIAASRLVTKKKDAAKLCQWTWTPHRRSCRHCAHLPRQRAHG